MKRTLEIGGGRTPYFIRYNLEVNPTDSYFVVDIDEKNIQYSKERMQDWKSRGQNVPTAPIFILGDANNMDFSDEFFDEIVISNTLSAPIHRNWDRDGNFVTIKNSKGETKREIPKLKNSQDPFYVERKNLINEAIRVLKTDGRIVVYTDLIVYGLDSYQRILHELMNDPKFYYEKDTEGEKRINIINQEKLASGEFCCCFRAEVLPNSEVYNFYRRNTNFS